MVKRLQEKDILRNIAEAGINRAILELEKKLDSEPETLKDSWSNNINAFKEIPVDRGSFDIGYTYLNNQTKETEFRYGMVDEERKININKAQRKVIKKLFQIVADLDEMQAQEAAACLIDWRDKDSQLSIPLGSAEDRYYRNLTHSYECKDADFEILPELLLVKEMNQELFNKIKDFVTVYGDGSININTAPKEVLLALGLDDDIVEKILSFRSGEDGIEGTADDNLFEQSSQIAARLSRVYHLSASQLAELSNTISAQNIGVDSHNFMIKSIAKLDTQPHRQMQIICVFNKDERRILYWHQE